MDMNAVDEILDVERNKLVVQYCKNLLKVANSEDLSSIESIYKRAFDTVNNYNNRERTVIDVSVIEDGMWRGNVKKVITARYSGHQSKAIKYPNNRNCKCYNDDDHCAKCKLLIKKYWAQETENKVIREKYKMACEKTIFPIDLKYKYILLCRKSDYHNRTPLERALSEIIHTEIETIFYNQNQSLIHQNHETNQ
jgi:hypothetical protein